MSNFVVGQRWASETEPELGLGTVVQVDGRRVSVAFTAADEIRQYAAAQAPLQRVTFAVGDSVLSLDGVALVVEAVHEEEGLLVYSGDGLTLPESRLADVAPGRGPEDRLLRGDVDPPNQFALRLETWNHRARIHASSVRGFLGARIDWLPHQLYIAARAVERDAPRLLLADEVGLGKTIEAALILHRLLLVGRVRRALVMAPEALVHQWFVELLRRFNLSVAIFNEARCEAAEPGSPGGNPFLGEQLVLVSEGFMASQPARREQAVQAGWDLVIIDEAHHLHWSPAGPSPMYAFAAALTAVAPAVLLLTATPEELGPESHFARLHLLDPARYPDLEAFNAEHLRHVDTAREAEQRLERGEPIDELLDRYGPGRVMFRNTRRHVKGFPRREVRLAPLADAKDRCAWLAGRLRELRGEKVLLICSSTAQVLKLEEELASQLRVKTALFHEALEIVQRDRSAAWFAEADGAQLLLCSEIGGEGRNFQFAHHLVLYDLPDRPERIEQRIGRLDRIGQRDTVYIHVPYVAGGREERWVRWLHEGLEAFTRCLQGADEIHEVFRDRLDDGDVDELVAATREFKADLDARLAAGTNRLLELHSFDETSAAATVAAVRGMDEDGELAPFALRLLDHFGVDAEPIDPHTFRFSPGHGFRDGLPGFPKEGMAATLDRGVALAREDRQFLTWDHPLVAGAMDQLLHSDQGTSAAVIWACDEPGLLVEAVFVVEATAPAALQPERFLPATAIRVAVDLSLQPVEDDVPLVLPDAGGSAAFVADEAAAQRVREMLDACRDRADECADAVREEAIQRMRATLGAERQRLVYLRSVNDHVHAEEIESVDDRIAQLDSAFAAAGVRLDAVRLVRCLPAG